jgi:chemotaxis-related protein WspD
MKPQASHADCWRTIGVRGDLSCPELEKHVHCRNCPVYSAAATGLLDAEPPSGYVEDWTGQLAREKPKQERDARSVLVFRLGAEWLGMPTRALHEIAAVRPIHSIPHRRDGVLLGLANIRGELRICVSLQRVLGLEEAAAPQRTASRRLLVLEREGSRAVCPVDEVHGIQRFSVSEMAPAPATVANAAATYTQAVLSWRGNTVGLLDDQLLFHTINRSLS